MKRVAMHINRGFMTGLLALVALSCEVADDMAQIRPSEEMITVTLSTGDRGIAVEEHTRTSLAEDGITVKWSESDKMQLWVESAAGESNTAEFALWRYDREWNHAYFRGSVPAMAEGQYNYYAASPIPAEHSGTIATYDIPAVQDGKYNSDWNILVAEPVLNAAPLAEGYNDALPLKFKSQVHILRIRIPRNDLGEEITRLDLSFTAPVAGRLDIDVANPGSAALRSEGASDVITLEFDSPKGAGDIVYAVIAPTAISATEPVQMMATGKISESLVQSFAGKNFAPGHITPIAYTPKFGRYTGTGIRFRLNETGRNTLGEDINTFTLNIEDAQGALFDNGSTSRTFNISQADADGEYEIFFRTDSDIDPQLLAGKKINVTYDSEHAQVSSSFTMQSSIALNVVNPVNTVPDVPYLMFEDFSKVSGGNSNYSKYGDNTVNAGSLDGVGLTGWTAARWQTTANTSFSLSAYAGSTFLGTSTDINWTRVDTRALPLKKGATVRIEYDVSGNTSANNGTTHCYFGTTTRTGAINGTLKRTECRPDNTVEDYTLGKGGSTTNINLHKNVMASADATTRLTWCLCYDINGTISGKYFYLYLDNIKVQIVN